jgi:type I restriction enzyme M protein
MRVNNKEGQMRVGKITEKLWEVFSTLRGEGIQSEDYHVLLFLLSAYKDGLVKIHLTNPKGQYLTDDTTSLSESLISVLRGCDKAVFEKYSAIIDVYEPLLKRLSNSGVNRMLSQLSELDVDMLNESFPEVFDSVLYQITQSKGRFAGESIQPVELTRFICGLSELQPNSRVYNPFAGLASFGVYLDKGQAYFGQESNQKTWALGTLRLMAHQRLVNSKYVHGDSILNWPESSQKYNLIITNPPMALRIASQPGDSDTKFRTVDQFVIEKGVNSLDNNGTLIVLIPGAFLFKAGFSHRLREYLVESDLVDSVISFPGGVLLNTAIPFIILVIKKSKNNPGYIKFINAKDFIESKGSRNKKLKDYDLLSVINTYKESESIRIISNTRIKECGYNLSLQKYFQKEVEGIPLSDLLDYFRPSSSEGIGIGKLIKSRNLKEDVVDPYLDLSTIQSTEINSREHRVISESCLLVSNKWKKLKPTLFNYANESLIVPADILCFRIKRDLVNENYLINELNAKYVSEQINSLSIGTSIPFIKINDLLSVKIKLPTIAEQNAKVQGIHELSDKIKSLQNERNALAHGISSKLFESISTIKHSMGKPLLNIGSSLRNIEKALSKCNGEWEKEKLNERYDLTIKDAFDSVYSNIGLIHSILRKNEAVLDLTNYPLSEIDIISFIKGYVTRVKSAERTNVSTILDIHPDIKTSLKNKIMVFANAELLEIGLNSIVENAIMHAFINDSKKYKLEIRISLYVGVSQKQNVEDAIEIFDNFIKVDVANNGKPFPKNYTLEKLIRKNSFAGETGNTGQGGFDLNEIIKYHNNGISTLQLITDDFTSEFTSTYSFLIPFNR